MQHIPNRLIQLHRRELLTSTLCLTGVILAGNSLRADTSDTIGTPKYKLEEMIGQMVIVGFWGSNPAAPGVQAVADWLQRRLIGGVIFFEDNLHSPSSAEQLTKLFREAAKPSAPLLCVDQEGGVVSRLRADRGFEPLPAALSIATTTPRNAGFYYDRTATELHRLGFNTNLGPVVDLSLNPKNSIIEGLGRSFGSEPATVVEFAKSFIESHHKSGIITAIKHFPGHGSTSVDSHQSLPDISNVWQKQELQPFAELIRARLVDTVLVGHLVHRDITGVGRPASLSSKAITDLLRGELGYSGVVVSDDMQMGAIRDRYSPEESIVLGVQAGVDLFIYSNREHADPKMPDRFVSVVRAAIEAGQLSSQCIEESCRRIRALKGKFHMTSAALFP
jgi:beta-N-acetylhexosaminidase